MTLYIFISSRCPLFLNLTDWVIAEVFILYTFFYICIGRLKTPIHQIVGIEI